ncbi:MAG: nitrogenase component 1, partial [Pyramidobacter sp.]|nr:nitrogenase component 1 [Pyramidobacter sp.]
MKGFYQYLAPFAPDYSGAACVFFGMDGLVVLCDPGGCSGNVCGYDEPRFYGSQQALFSAAIRDMDAILGKDDLLERKIVQAASEREYRFIALVGTPVVSVIASDLKGVANLLSRKTGIAAVSVDTDGMKLYDTGAEKAYMALLRLPGALERVPSDGERLGVFGASPLEMPSRLSLDRFKELVRRSFPSASAAFYGGEPLPSLPDRTLAVSPSGLKACRFLKERFGIPYSVSFPMNPEFERVLNEARGRCGSKILIIHQQAAACALRSLLIASGAGQR